MFTEYQGTQSFEGFSNMHTKLRLQEAIENETNVGFESAKTNE